MPRTLRQVERGDWQTPSALAALVIELLRRRGPAPRVVLEPTVGRGAFLSAARAAFPDARLVGRDVDPAHLAAARRSLRGASADLAVADCFDLDWEALVAGLPDPLLVVGNPPWVTSSTQGALGTRNLPAKTNQLRLPGLSARTGLANFDVAEWLIARLASACASRRFTLAMLCKASVARRLLQRWAGDGSALRGALYAIDARAAFGAAVSAVLLVVTPGQSARRGAAAAWPVYPSLTSRRASRYIGVAGGRPLGDVDAWAATRALERRAAPDVRPATIWRSGVKHDASAVLELVRRDGALWNAAGARVDVEPDHLFPLLKGADVAAGREPGTRWLLLPQRGLGDDTRLLKQLAPRTWRYLELHAARFAARKSSIYRERPPYSVFGVGPYSFAPYKVAISGLHKRLTFRVVGPVEGRPVLLDDTCYFLACPTRSAALRAHAWLTRPEATRFFEARIFWDEKRPIQQRVLSALDLPALPQRGSRGTSRRA